MSLCPFKDADSGKKEGILRIGGEDEKIFSKG